MIMHSNTTPEELINYLRDMYVRYGAKPQVIDALDNLRELRDAPAELEKVGEELTQAEDDRGDLHEELSLAAESLELAIDTIASIAESPADAAEMIDADELHGLQRQLKASKSALERHK